MGCLAKLPTFNVGVVFHWSDQPLCWRRAQRGAEARLLACEQALVATGSIMQQHICKLLRHEQPLGWMSLPFWPSLAITNTAASCWAALNQLVGVPAERMGATTVAPASKKARAMPSPTIPVAPVMTATRPSSTMALPR